MKQTNILKYHVYFSDADFTIKSGMNIMLNEYWKQKIIKPTNTTVSGGTEICRQNR